jgi:hypothetical protein
LDNTEERILARRAATQPPRDAAWVLDLSRMTFGSRPTMGPEAPSMLTGAARAGLYGAWLSADPFTGRAVAVLTFWRGKGLTSKTTLVAAEGRDGSLLWQKDVDQLRLVSPGLVVVKTRDRFPTLEAYRPDTGERIRPLSPEVFDGLLSPGQPRQLWPAGWKDAAGGLPASHTDGEALRTWALRDPLGIQPGRIVVRSLATTELNQGPFAWGSTRRFYHLLAGIH